MFAASFLAVMALAGSVLAAPIPAPEVGMVCPTSWSPIMGHGPACHRPQVPAVSASPSPASDIVLGTPLTLDTPDSDSASPSPASTIVLGAPLTLDTPDAVDTSDTTSAPATLPIGSQGWPGWNPKWGIGPVKINWSTTTASAGTAVPTSTGTDAATLPFYPGVGPVLPPPAATT